MYFLGEYYSDLALNKMFLAFYNDVSINKVKVEFGT